MKFSSQEELGLRILLQIARHSDQVRGITIQEISAAEGITIPNVGKLVRLLRLGGFVGSNRGQNGGYILARKSAEIRISEVLTMLGGRLYESGYCQRFTETDDDCSHTLDCTVRVVWQKIQAAVDDALRTMTLAELMSQGKAEPVPVQIMEFRPSVPS